jgi:four helix bundle protein
MRRNELRKVASNQIASIDSVHRNIAEGYCRRTINEYLQFLNVALASLGESVSGMHVYIEAKQLDVTAGNKVSKNLFTLLSVLCLGVYFVNVKI